MPLDTNADLDLLMSRHDPKNYANDKESTRNKFILVIYMCV